MTDPVAANASAQNLVTAPYGTWRSPISADHISSQKTTFADLATSPSGAIYVVERRSGGEDDGRNAIVAWPPGSHGEPQDILPAPHSAKTKVHGYGGGSIAVDPVKDDVVFSNQGGGVWAVDPNSHKVTPIVDSEESVHFADFDVSFDGKWIVAIREDHRHAESAADVKNSLVAIERETGRCNVLVEGADFYTHPRVSPDGSKLSFIQWSHPDMPWTGTELFVYDFDGEKGALLGKPRFTEGRASEMSIAQPRWGIGETLFYNSDRSGTWQFEYVKFDTPSQFGGWASGLAQKIHLENFEDGDFAEPEWRIGSSTYTQLDPDTLVATWNKNAQEQLVRIDLSTNRCEKLNWELTDIRGNSLKRVNEKEFAVIGSTFSKPSSLYRSTVPPAQQSTTQAPTLLRSSLHIDLNPTFCSRARHIDFPRKDRLVVAPSGYAQSHDSGSYDVHSTSHAYFLPPTNPNYTAPPNTLPPLIVLTHGGPTSHRGPGLSLQVQYFTTRGFAVALANPVGSSGYGRAYREALNAHWGIADAADVAACASHITRTLKLADPERVGTVGGSAGGYVTLQALYLHPELWCGGVSLYGISDVRRLVAGTHKFESWYARRLLFGASGPDPDQETTDRVYRERSARFHVDRITAPLLLLQGDADEVVPLDQAKEMERAMRDGGKKVRLVVFDGEGHGFIRAENEKRAIREEQAWWVKNLVRRGKEELEIEDRWIWVDESSGDEKAKANATT